MSPRGMDPECPADVEHSAGEPLRPHQGLAVIVPKVPSSSCVVVGTDPEPFRNGGNLSLQLGTSEDPFWIDAIVQVSAGLDALPTV